MEIDEV
jgi:hypothetical protein